MKDIIILHTILHKGTVNILLTVTSRLIRFSGTIKIIIY